MSGAGDTAGDSPGDTVSDTVVLHDGVRGSVRLPLAVAMLVVILDQFTKAWALRALVDRDIHLIWTLQLNLAFNTGMAFSRGRGLGPVIGVFALVIVVVLLVRLGREGGRLATVATGLVVGGAIGNICDRLFRGDAWLHGAVVDFIDLQWFPIFNIADMAITVGGSLLVLTAVVGPRP